MWLELCPFFQQHSLPHTRAPSEEKTGVRYGYGETEDIREGASLFALCGKRNSVVCVKSSSAMFL